MSATPSALRSAADYIRKLATYAEMNLPRPVYLCATADEREVTALWTYGGRNALVFASRPGQFRWERWADGSEDDATRGSAAADLGGEGLRRRDMKDLGEFRGLMAWLVRGEEV